MNWKLLFDIIYTFFTYAIFIYSGTQLVFYILIGLFSVRALKKYANKNSFVDYKLLAVSPYAPSISILAPAYNEGANIIENVRSLLSIYYNNLELIVINDGSKDDSLSQLIKAYDLVKIDFFVSYQIKTKEVRGVYRSRNPVFNKLVVVDKANGGKADALNVGINVASNDYIVCIDVDCVLAPDALLKLMKPFLETAGEKIIATGGVVRIANSCEIQHGRLVKVKLPKKYLPRMQTLEYIRSFLLGRMAWSKLNGLLLISGAFGAFDKEIVIKVGGYDPKTVGEDMELLVRMRRYMIEQQLPYKVAFIPDPLCWTEAPGNYKILGRQRNRWTRGTIETLSIHKKMFFNGKYGILGLLCYPYWFFFEMCAPGVEFVGMLAFCILAALHMVYWQTFFAFFAFIITFGYLYSSFAIYMEVKTYNQYNRKREVLKLYLSALTEPFVFHPFIVLSGVSGYIDKWRRKSAWGEMTRQGLNRNILGGTVAPVMIDDLVAFPTTPLQSLQSPQKQGLLYKLKSGLQQAAVYNMLVLVCMLLVKTFELVRNTQLHGMPGKLNEVMLFGYANEISFALSMFLVSGFVFTSLFLISRKLAHFIAIIFSVLAVMIHAGLSQYFLETLVPLGADLFNYSFAEVQQTLGAAGSINPSSVTIILLTLIAVIFLFTLLPKKIKFTPSIALGLILLMVSARMFLYGADMSHFKQATDANQNLSLNKSAYFYSSAFNHIDMASQPADPYIATKQVVVIKDTASLKDSSTAPVFTQTYVDEAQYPFLHTVDTASDVLSPFFNKDTIAPNFVFIIVEGLGSAFSNKDAYLGSFTPFLDSLSAQSLYWPNMLSAAGRTFAVLPSLFGSLPYGKNGFAVMGNKMPEHMSLLSILKQNGYSTQFNYGGDASFDNMSLFMQRNSTPVMDNRSFSAKYKTMPSSSGFSWGYGDEELFNKYNENTRAKKPYCNILLTLSTHSPFLINSQNKYLGMFEQHMNTLGFSDVQKEEHRFYKKQYASILYSDNAIRQFITSYTSRPEFKNTIFIITGDHRMPEIPMSTKIDRYHVPLIIYSPLLKQSKTFASVSSHLDVTPSILSFLGHQYRLPFPAQASWLGSGLDTSSTFRNIHAYPLMPNKHDLGDFVMDNYMLNGENLFEITNKLDLIPVDDEMQKRKLQNALDIFRQRNNRLINGAPLMATGMLAKNKL